jgi:hypothetical protein
VAGLIKLFISLKKKNVLYLLSSGKEYVKKKSTTSLKL